MMLNSDLFNNVNEQRTKKHDLFTCTNKLKSKEYYIIVKYLIYSVVSA